MGTYPSRDTQHTSLITHVLALLCINQQTKFEVPSFTTYTDMIVAKLKNKLAPYGTDSRLFTTDVSAKLKVT